MHMLKSRAQNQCRTDKHVIQFLAIHIIHVRIPFRARRQDNIIQIEQVRDGFEGFEGLHERKFVEIACYYYLGEGIEFEDLCDECL